MNPLAVSFKKTKVFIRLLDRYVWALPVVVLLGLTAAIFEGIGLSLFVPFLQSLDPAFSGTGSASSPLQLIQALFNRFPAEQRLVLIPLCIVGSIFLKNVVIYANSALFSWLNWKVSHELRAKVFRQLLTVGISFVERRGTGEFLSILDKETWQTSQALFALVNMVISACTIVVFTGLLLIISWRLTLVVALLTLLISLGVQLITKRVKRVGRQAAAANAEFVSRALEGIAGMRVIRSFGREAMAQQRFDAASQQVCASFRQLDLLSALIGPFSEVFSAVLLMGVSILALHKQANLPIVLTFLFMLYRLQPQVRRFDSARVGLLSLLGSVEKVLDLLDTEGKPYILSGDVPLTTFSHSIVFSSVDFRYLPSEPAALTSLSCVIEKGKTTAIVGPSGAGKSTLIDLMCRYYDPTAGEIYVDGCLLSRLRLSDWRSHIAIVAQDNYLFNQTIHENIGYGQMDLKRSHIITAAKQANAHDFITQMPDGYDTVIGDRGVRLSGGQRQRLALARAILRGSEILVLDEATNALDSISESLIQEALATFGAQRTMIVIAHRLSTIESADHILVMDEGRCVEQGSFETLMALEGLFHKMYGLQRVA